MTDYDDLLREKENDDLFNNSSMEKHWAALEKKIDTNTNQPRTKYRKLLRSVIGIAAVLLLVFFSYTFFKEKKQQSLETIATTIIKSAIIPPLNGLDVPYEVFSFNAATGDTIFTLNGSVIIFPKNALLNSKGEVVNGNIEVRTREFNDAFDYSIAGIPMDYDSAGVQYKFISSGMIDINAYQNGQLLLVNPAAKPQLNLVSTNKERKTNLYKLDTVSGKWLNKGSDEGKLVALKKTATDSLTSKPDNTGTADKFAESKFLTMPAAPQKASNLNPIINIKIDPESFKELLVYNGLKFEVTDHSESVGEDAKTEWDNIELKKGTTSGTYKVKFSAKNKTVEYKVKPVLEGKDFEAAEKLYREKLKEYSRIQNERKKSDKKLEKDNERMQEANKRAEELNKLVIMRNKFIEAENIKIEALNKENRRLIDSAIKANNELIEARKKEIEKQQTIWEQSNRIAALEQNLIHSFEIDGFGYWNCDQPTLPEVQQYVSSLRTRKNELVTYTTLCIATEGINRIQNYYSTNTIGLIPNSSYFGWAFNANQIYYFTEKDFENAAITKNPNTISISMTLYQGDVKNYNELKGFIFKVKNSTDISKK